MKVYVLLKQCEVDQYGYWLEYAEIMGVFASLEAAKNAALAIPNVTSVRWLKGEDSTIGYWAACGVLPDNGPGSVEVARIEGFEVKE